LPLGSTLEGVQNINLLGMGAEAAEEVLAAASDTRPLMLRFRLPAHCSKGHSHAAAASKAAAALFGEFQ
jgi:hypothetical protein